MYNIESYISVWDINKYNILPLLKQDIESELSNNKNIVKIKLKLVATLESDPPFYQFDVYFLLNDNKEIIKQFTVF